MTRRLIGRDSFEDMLSQPLGSELTRPGALLETVLDLADAPADKLKKRLPESTEKEKEKR